MMTALSKAGDLSAGATAFEDILDGYFPLQESLRQMLQRNGFASACARLSFAPIMEIPGLAPTDPVPMRCDYGTVGLADRIDLIVSQRGSDLGATVQVSGYGRWRWYAHRPGFQDRLPSSTRLAEPAIVSGIGLTDGALHAQVFDRDRMWQDSDFAVIQKQ